MHFKLINKNLSRFIFTFITKVISEPSVQNLGNAKDNTEMGGYVSKINFKLMNRFPLIYTGVSGCMGYLLCISARHFLISKEMITTLLVHVQAKAISFQKD